MTKQDTWPKWYAVHTWPKGEGVADRSLRSVGYWTFFPFVRRWKNEKLPNSDRYRVRRIDEPYFSRYIFVALRDKDEDMGGINNCHGVSTVVYCGEEPLEIPHSVMDELMGRADGGGLVEKIDKIEAGERRKFKSGEKISPLAGLMAEVEVDAGKEVKVWVEMLGSRRLVTVRNETAATVIAP